MQKYDQSESEVYDDGYLRVEYGSYYVACGGQPIYNLSRLELLLLFRLVRNFERLVTYDELWEAAWGRGTLHNIRHLRVQVSNIRMKLLPYRLNITSMPNVGYRLTKGEDEEVQ